jgi:hypothetical protein
MLVTPMVTGRFMLLIFIAAIAPTPLWAQPPQALSDGISAYNQVEYPTALMYLKAAVRRARTRTHLTQAYFYLGCTYLATEQQEAARAAFETLLALDPAHVPSRQLTSPKIARFFADVRQSYATPAGPPSMAHRPPRSTGDRMTTLTLELHNLSPRLRPILRHRSAATPGYMTTEAVDRREALVYFSVPTPTDGGRDLRYYFALVDGEGVQVQRLGSSRRPFRTHVGGDAREGDRDGTTWYSSWWFWTAVGAVTVGAGVGLGLGLRSGDDSSQAQVTVLRRDGSGVVVPVFQ